MKSKKRPEGIVYSTDPDFRYSYGTDGEQETLPTGQQDLRVHVIALKGNKKSTLVKGFVGTEDDLKALAKKLKASCGVGGSAKDGEIIIQGDKRDQVISILLSDGFKAKRSGG